MGSKFTGQSIQDCPTCGARMDIRDSRPAACMGLPSMRRRRHCAACKHGFTSYEISEASLVEMKNRVQRTLKLVTAAKAIVAAEALDAIAAVVVADG